MCKFPLHPVAGPFALALLLSLGWLHAGHAESSSPLYTAASLRHICIAFHRSLAAGEPSALGLLCTGYVQGVIDAVGRTRLCLPDRLSASDASRVIEQYDDRNGNGQRPAAILVTEALQQRYCSRKP